MSQPLELRSVIGFSGAVPNGLIAHPDGETVIYPLGSTVVLRNKHDPSKQEFLRGHSDEVSCIALSRSGRYLASGQKTYMGFKADIIVWDLTTKQVHKKLALHKVMVRALDFSFNESKLASLGGPDDASLVLWDVATGEAMCGSPTSGKFLETVKFLNQKENHLATAGQGSIHIWEYIDSINKLKYHAIETGKLVRNIHTLTVSPDDEFLYAGTHSGDVLQINLHCNILKCTGPSKLLSGGVTASCNLPGNDCILVGTGKGLVGVLAIPRQADAKAKNPKHAPKLTLLMAAEGEGTVTSISVDSATAQSSSAIAYFGTAAGNIYQALVDMRSRQITLQLVQSAHPASITAVTFPEAYGEVFATASFAEIRIWHINSCRELLRINVANLACNCLAFTHDGSALLSGWDDGTVRAYGPQTGKPLFTVKAHHKAVTAVAGCQDGERFLSGGEEGLVCVWHVSPNGSVKMLASMKDHRGSVNSIMVSPKTGAEAISASSDGCCIIWDLETVKRRASFFSNTFFKSVAYHPDESQAVTTGTDRKIAYWDVYDGSAVRVVDACEEAAMCDVSVDVLGEVIVSGGANKLVQVWGYDQGYCYFTGVGHSRAVNRVRISPDRLFIVSVGSEGGIFIWTYASPSSDGTLDRIAAQVTSAADSARNGTTAAA